MLLAGEFPCDWPNLKMVPGYTPGLVVFRLSGAIMPIDMQQLHVAAKGVHLTTGRPLAPELTVIVEGIWVVLDVDDD